MLGQAGRIGQPLTCLLGLCLTRGTLHDGCGHDSAISVQPCGGRPTQTEWAQARRVWLPPCCCCPHLPLPHQGVHEGTRAVVSETKCSATEGGGMQALRRIPTAEGAVGGVSVIKSPPRLRVRVATAGDVPPAAFETIDSHCCSRAPWRGQAGSSVKLNPDDANPDISKNPDHGCVR